jgi:hypothetical protein
MSAISPSQSNIQQAIAAFLSAVLPGIPGSQPAVFPGTIAGTTLTVAPLPGKQPFGIQGTIQLNAPLLGLGVAPGTTIVAQLSGTTGGVGTYQVSRSQALSQSATMSTGVTIVTGQQNRVAEPANPYFAILTPLRFDRLATNIDESADVKFTGAISGTVLSVSAVTAGSIQPGATIFGTGALLPGTAIINQLSGSVGGTGTYTIAPSQTLPSQTLSCGQKTMTQNAMVSLQIDCHSIDLSASDFAQQISTCLRDEFGVNFFAALPAPLNEVVPLYADDPVQAPFISGENQFEYRWITNCKLEVQQVAVVPQKYSDSATIILTDVDATFPP